MAGFTINPKESLGGGSNMSDVGFRRVGTTHNWGKAGSAAGGGPGGRNSYIATPSGVEQALDADHLGEVGGPTSPRHQPFNPANIVQVNLGDLLAPEADSLDMLDTQMDF